MAKFYVYLVGEHDECTVFRSDKKEDAIDYARSQWLRMCDYDRKHTKVLIRSYVCDIEDEDCTCFDHDIIDWKN